MLPLMATSTLEFNNSVSLNPRRKTEATLQKIPEQDDLTHFDEKKLQMLQRSEQAVHRG